MHLILGIHCSGHEEVKVAEYLTANLKKDKNTFFIYFNFYSGPHPLRLSEVQKHRPELKHHLIELSFDPKYGRQHHLFGGYSASFLATLQKLQQKLKESEKVQSTGIGGSAWYCYKNINAPAQKKIQRVFGNKLSRQQSFLPLIGGSAYASELRLGKLLRTRRTPPKRRARIPKRTHK